MASKPRHDRASAAREKPAARREEPSSREEPERTFMTRSAGLVLLWPLMTRYFDRLGLLADGSFTGVEAQERATGWLQFLATGQVSFQEPDLVLNKVLCGLAPESPVPTAVEVDDATRAMTEGLLSFVLQQWPALKNTSVQGLRGSFLCREGRLQAGDENWTLEVEPKAYDLLLDSWPWPLSIVKLPWMPRPLHVRWRK